MQVLAGQAAKSGVDEFSEKNAAIDLKALIKKRASLQKKLAKAEKGA